MRILNILYCHGLGSSINNRVGQGLMEYFDKSPHYFERLLYRNPGSKNHTWNISEWKEDIEKRIEGEEWILMASSAGGHAALNVAKQMPKNVKGLFLFCPGTSLGISYVESIQPGAIEYLRQGGTIIHPASRNGYEALLDMNCLQHYLDTCVTKFEGLVDIKCPVSIVHGTKDEIVPYENSLILAKRLTSLDVEVTLVKGGTHYLSVDETIRSKLDKFIEKFLSLDKI